MKTNIKNLMTILMLAIMLLCGLSATADATIIVAGNPQITIANRATTSQKFGSDITINGSATDMVAGSTISLTCPSGLKFDTRNISLQIGSNISYTGGFVVSLFNGTGYTSGYSSDGRIIKLEVITVPPTGTGSVKFSSTIGNNDDLAVLPSNPNDTSIDSTGLQFSVVTNGDTASPVTTTIGTINILKVPTITSAYFIDSTHFTIQFNCSIDSSTATSHSTALGSGKSYTFAASPYGLYIANAVAPVSNATAAIDGSDPTKVNITITNGALKTDGTSTVMTTTQNQQFVNAKDTQTTPAMTSRHANAPHTAINITVEGPCISAITLSKTTVGCSTGYIDRITGLASDSSTYCMFTNGRPIDSNSQILNDAFIATINSCSGFAYKVRLAYYSVAPTIPLTSNNNAWQADCVSGSTTVLYNDTGSSGKHTISGANNDGALNIYFQLGNNLSSANSNLAAGTAGQIIVQASMDDFATTSGIISSNPITVDRIVPTVDQSIANRPQAIDATTIQAMFSEPVKKTTAEYTGSYRVFTTSGGGVEERAIQSASLASDNKTVTVTTTVLPSSASTSIIFSPARFTGFKFIPDPVGNRVPETIANFTSPYSAGGGNIYSITVTQPSTTPPRVANGSILSVQVNADTGATIKVRLANATIASTTTSYWDTGVVTLTEVTPGVYRTIPSFPIVNAAVASGSLKVIASSDNFATRVVDDEVVTVDNTGPSVVSANAIGNRKVVVNFNETLYTTSSSVTAANFSITPTTGILSISSAVAQPSKTAVLLSFTGTASTGITYTVTASSSVKDETTINGVGTANYATFTTSGPDTIAPTISSVVVAEDRSKVTAYVTDNFGTPSVDINSNVIISPTKVFFVTKDGIGLDGVITNDVYNVACIFTPTDPFMAGIYYIYLNAADLSGNMAIRSRQFVIYDSLNCSASPQTITTGGDTSTISVTGGKAPYTVAIISDTTGGAMISGSGPWTLTPGTSTGTITVQISDSQLPAETCSVSVNVIECSGLPDITVGTVITCNSGTQIEVPVTISDTAGRLDMSFSVSFDKTKLQYTGKSLGTMNASFLTATIDAINAAGKVQPIVYFEEGGATSGIICKFKFTLLTGMASGSQTPLTIGDITPSETYCGISGAVTCSEPTLISLSSFTATPYHRKVVIEWVTESEIDNTGFNLYRAESEDGEYIKLNVDLIPSEGSGIAGEEYMYIDEEVNNHQTYYYLLEDMDLYGITRLHGPVSATPRRINK